VFAPSTAGVLVGKGVEILVSSGQTCLTAPWVRDPGGRVNDKQATPGEWTIMGAGAVMLIASFLNFASKTSAWGSGLFPIATLIVVYGVLMALQIVLTKFANVQMPDRLAGFTWEQLHLAFGVFALLMSLGWLISGIPSKSIGFWLLLLGSVALVVGALMLQRERNTGAIP
jgi:hypothetical protein